ncbi:MAG: hypothetical protein ACTSRZ_18235 [Promethearchaeota archaeon]
MTTRPPPKVKKRRQGWSHHIYALYDHRWQIEAGFKDLNRITPSSNARSEARKFIMTTVMYCVYNSW